MSNTIIGVRVTPEDRNLLDKVCAARGEDIREELTTLSFYSEETKKGQGTKKESSR